MNASHRSCSHNIFENILHQVKCSNLNFKIDLSPFSAVISLKKSLVKDKSWISRLPPPIQTPPLHRLSEENQILSDKTLQQEKELKSDYENSALDCEDIRALRNDVNEKENKLKMNKIELKNVQFNHEKINLEMQ